MVGTPLEKLDNKFDDQDIQLIWDIVQSCNTLESTRLANNCIDYYIKTRRMSYDVKVIKDMREELYYKSYDMFMELQQKGELV